jgi:hypothetical protein
VINVAVLQRSFVNLDADEISRWVAGKIYEYFASVKDSINKNSYL